MAQRLHTQLAGKLWCMLCLLLILPAASGRQIANPFNTTVGTQQQQQPVLVEYLGALGEDFYINQVPVVEATVPYYLLLSFAIDAHPDGSQANGVFSPYWTETLDPKSLAQFKAAHPNVKLLASLSGWSIYTTRGKTKTLFWYQPRNESEWIHNAVTSLSKIVQTYSLDGIDVDYESFPTVNRFSHLMGTVIQQLKSSGAISVASITPFSITSKHYLGLFQEFGSYIDLVNYQFYTDRVPTAAKFVERYNLTGQIWGFDKLVASFAIGGPGVSGDNFFVALDELQTWLWTEKKLVGPSIMIWSAEDGSKSKPRFKFEKQAQTFVKNLQAAHPDFFF